MLTSALGAPLALSAAAIPSVYGLRGPHNTKIGTATDPASPHPLEQGSLLLHEHLWDDRTGIWDQPLALYKQRIASDWEDLPLSDEIGRKFFYLVRTMTFDRHPEPLLRRGLESLRQLLILGSPSAVDNTLYEYLCYQVFAAIVTLKDAALLEDFVALLAAPFSLDDLTVFCLKKNILTAFEFSGTGQGASPELQACLDYIERLDLEVDMVSDLQNSIRALAHLKAGGKYSAGIDHDLRELTPERIAVKLFLCCQSDAGIHWLRKAVQAIRHHPYPLPLYLRLFSNLGGDTSMHKVIELFMFPWTQHTSLDFDTYCYVNPEILAGTIHTGFRFDPDLSEGLHTLYTARQRIDQKSLRSRRLRMEELIAQRPSDFRKVNETSIALLLRLQPTHTARVLADRIQRKGIKVVGLSDAELQELNEERKARNPNDTGTCASYRLGDGKSEPPAILVPEFGGKYSRQEIAFMAHHEGRHLDQAEQHGSQWIGENLITAEMDAWSWDMSLRLINGNDTHIKRFAALSPFCFGLGLQNGLEQLYKRHLKLPRSQR